MNIAHPFATVQAGLPRICIEIAPSVSGTGAVLTAIWGIAQATVCLGRVASLGANVAGDSRLFRMHFVPQHACRAVGCGEGKAAPSKVGSQAASKIRLR